MGPFKVTKKVNEVAYQLALPEGWQLHNFLHVSLLKPYYKDGRHQPPPPSLLLDREKEFEVEDILGHDPKNKIKPDRTMKFFVKLKGFGHENNTCEPFRNMNNAPLVLKELGQS